MNITAPLIVPFHQSETAPSVESGLFQEVRIENTTALAVDTGVV